MPPPVQPEAAALSSSGKKAALLYCLAISSSGKFCGCPFHSIISLTIIGHTFFFFDINGSIMEALHQLKVIFKTVNGCLASNLDLPIQGGGTPKGKRSFLVHTTGASFFASGSGTVRPCSNIAVMCLTPFCYVFLFNLLLYNSIIATYVNHYFLG